MSKAKEALLCGKLNRPDEEGSLGKWDNWPRPSRNVCRGRY